MKVYCVFAKLNECSDLISICTDFIRAETLKEGLNEQSVSVPSNIYYVEEREVF
jgi:hypothetical protein